MPAGDTVGTFAVYGWSLRSDFSLWLRSTDGPADLVVESRVEPQPASGGQHGSWSATPGLFVVDLPGRARATVRDGRTIEILRSADVPETDLQRFLLGPVAAAVMHQRHTLPFHASAVSRDGRALLIAGDSAAGKSDVALCLLRRDWRFISDDVTPISIVDGVPMASPGPAAADVWRGTRERYGARWRSISTGSSGKTLLDLDEAAERVPVPVAVTCILTAYNGAMEWNRLSGVEAFRRLRSKLHHVRGMHAAGVDAGQVLHLQALIAATPVWELRYPRLAGSSADVAAALEDRFRGSSA